MTNQGKTADYYRLLPYTRRIRVVEDAPENSYFVAFIEELGGVEADGSTPEEAYANLAEAFEDYLSAMLEWGETIPEPESWPASAGWPDTSVRQTPAEVSEVRKVPEDEGRQSPEWITGVPGKGTAETREVQLA